MYRLCFGDFVEFTDCFWGFRRIYGLFGGDSVEYTDFFVDFTHFFVDFCCDRHLCTSSKIY